jgi:hypothetical protein
MCLLAEYKVDVAAQRTPLSLSAHHSPCRSHSSLVNTSRGPFLNVHLELPSDHFNNTARLSSFPLNYRPVTHQPHTPNKPLPTSRMAEHNYKFNITMTCGGCSGAVERVLKKLEGKSILIV